MFFNRWTEQKKTSECWKQETKRPECFHPVLKISNKKKALLHNNKPQTVTTTMTIIMSVWDHWWRYVAASTSWGSSLIFIQNKNAETYGSFCQKYNYRSLKYQTACFPFNSQSQEETEVWHDLDMTRVYLQIKKKSWHASKSHFYTFTRLWESQENLILISWNHLAVDYFGSNRLPYFVLI